MGTVYRRGQLWSIAWVQNGAKQYEHGLPDEDTARRVLAVRIGDLAAGRSGLKPPKPSGPLTQLVECGSRTVATRIARPNRTSTVGSNIWRPPLGDPFPRTQEGHRQGLQGAARADECRVRDLGARRAPARRSKSAQVGQRQTRSPADLCARVGALRGYPCLGSGRSFEQGLDDRCLVAGVPIPSVSRRSCLIFGSRTSQTFGRRARRRRTVTPRRRRKAVLH
jgi:hypothetical protein